MVDTDREHAESLDAADPLALLRTRFVVEDEIVYVDGNSLGRLPHAVRDRLSTTVEEWGSRLVQGWADWIDLPTEVGDRLAAAVLGADPGEVIVTDSVTINLYKLASAALDARPDRRSVVIDADDFPTDRYVIEGLAHRRGLELGVMADAPLEGHRPEEVASMCAAVQPALVVLSHVNYRTGALLDMPAVTKAVHDHGSLMLWDLSHSAGLVPIELAGSGADLAVGCTYKYMNAGPGAPAFLYVRSELQERLRSPIWGWFGQRGQFEMGPTYEPEAGVARFLAGTPPISGIASVDAALEPIEEAGLDAIWAKAQALTQFVVDLHDAWLAPLGLELGTPRASERRGGHVSVRHPDARQLCRALIELEGVVPDFRGPDSIRLGLSPLYTRFVDAWDAVDRLRRLVETGEYRAVQAAPGRIT